MSNTNIKHDYFMGDTKCESAQVEKDLGVIVDQSLSGSSQCAVAVKMANMMLGYLVSSVTNHEGDVW